jgi:electron transfer flavoprotein alpha subunit
MSENKGVFIIGEILDNKLSSISTELLGVGRRLSDELGQELCAVFIGAGISEVAKDAIFFGADRVYIIDAPMFGDYLTDSYVAALEKLNGQTKPEILLLGQTSMGRDLAPALAFRLKTGVTLDCVELSIDPETKLLQKTKPVYGGNALATYVCEEGRPQLATIRTKVMTPLMRDTSRKGEVIFFDPQIDESAVRGRVVNKMRDDVIGVKLEDANVVICGGRGMGGAESFKQLEELASILNGAVGATRPPCDAKWVPDYFQIGLTGKIVTPALYIGVALSGASQHLAGISGAKSIVAINKDPEANIFKFAHFGIIGNYEKILPAFIENCRKLLP